MTGQLNQEARAVFLAALEYGVSPLVDPGYEPDGNDGLTNQERAWWASKYRHHAMRPLTERERQAVRDFLDRKRETA